MLEWLVLIPLAPLAGFVVIGLLGLAGRMPPRAAHTIAVGASALGFVLSVAAVADFANGVDRYVDRAAAHPDTYEVVTGDAHRPARFEVTVAEWLPLGETELNGAAEGPARASVSIGWTFAIDTLTAIMLLFVTGIGTLIHVYSIGYMAGEPGTWRFFCYLNLFMASMLTLVLAANVPVMFVGWEGVGLCSYLLIGFYYDRIFDRESGMTCADAGRKAFITNRIGDFGFLIGALLLLVTFGSWDFSEIAGAVNGSSAHWYGSGLLTLAVLLLFVGAAGKSAQIPLYVWLPDAMAGPTPVSALIHAATMVTAGVYMLCRVSALLWHAPEAMFVVALVGCGTAVFAGTMGMAQYDIKKILAYSTVSQLGYMFLGIGVGAFVAAMFHVVTHAFFKACLFLGAGSIIARCGHSNDIRHYGGLRRFMPITHATFLVATLALAGMPLLSGFMSKDEILAWARFSNHGALGFWIAGTAGAVLTSFYMFRCVWLTFYGENRTPEPVRSRLGESPPVMTGVLVALAVGAVVVGFIGVPAGVSNLVGLGDVNWFEHRLHPVVAAQGVPAAESHVAALGGEHTGGDHGTAEHAAAEHTATGHAATEHAAGGSRPVVREGWRRHPSIGEEWALFGIATLVFLLGLGLAWWAYSGGAARAEALMQPTAYVRRLLHRKWFVDELYDRVVIRPFWGLSRFFAGFDQRVVDGAVNVTASASELTGQIVKLFQTGVARHYAIWMLFGAVLMLWIFLR